MRINRYSSTSKRITTCESDNGFIMTTSKGDEYVSTGKYLVEMPPTIETCRSGRESHRPGLRPCRLEACLFSKLWKSEERLNTMYGKIPSCNAVPKMQERRALPSGGDVSKGRACLRLPRLYYRRQTVGKGFTQRASCAPFR